MIALDVGRGQLHARLAADARVVRLDRTNARELRARATCRTRPTCSSRTSRSSPCALVLEPALAALRRPWRAVVLVKPQFEAGRDDVARGGVVRDEAVRERALADVARYAAGLGAVLVDACDSQHPGPAGNREYLLALASPDHPAARDRAPLDPDDLARTAVHG